MPPTVSVVIACRDAEETLGVQLAALARQECPVAWNVVIADNGSTDGSVEIARSFADRLDVVVVDASAQGGAGYARNVGARATQAPFLAFCDADDEVGEGWLAAMVEGLRRHPFVAGRFEAYRLNDARAMRTRTLQQDDALQTSPFGPDLPHAGAGNLGIHRSVFLAVGGFDPAVGCLEDSDLCWRVQLAGVELVFWPGAVLHVRLRSSLRGMWRQGVAYGRAAALLDARYRSDRLTLVPVTTPYDAAGARGLGERLRTAARVLTAERSVGGMLWTLGWHVGHRSLTEAEVPALPPVRPVRPEPVVLPRAAGEDGLRAG